MQGAMVGKGGRGPGMGSRMLVALPWVLRNFLPMPSMDPSLAQAPAKGKCVWRSRPYPTQSTSSVSCPAQPPTLAGGRGGGGGSLAA